MVIFSFAYLHRANCSSDPAAAELALELDGLPLALAQAGAYISQVGVSFQDYLRHYKEAYPRFRQLNIEAASFLPLKLCVPFLLSVLHIKQERELSFQLLQQRVYFDNEDLRFDLLCGGRPGGPEWLCQLMENKLSFDQMVTLLRDYGLVERNKYQEGIMELEGCRMHSLVHKMTVHILNKRWNVMMAVLALVCVASHIPPTHSPNSSATERRLVPHAARRLWRMVRLATTTLDRLCIASDICMLSEESTVMRSVRALSLNEQLVILIKSYARCSIYERAYVYVSRAELTPIIPN